MRAIVARPNVCGYNAFHTSGGVLLRPSSTAADSALRPVDVWVWKQLGEIGTALTGYTVALGLRRLHLGQVDTMSGAADDWAYEHLGVYAWTTEFWDVVQQATGEQAVDALLVHSARPTTRRWPCCAGATSNAPTSTSPGTRSTTRSWARSSSAAGTRLGIWTNPPLHLLRDEVTPHADFAVHQALCSPRLGDRPHGRRRPRRRHLAGRGRDRQHRLAADRTCPPAARKDQLTSSRSSPS